MLTERFDPIDAEDLHQKAKDLTAQGDERHAAAGHLDDPQITPKTDGADDQPATAKTLVSRLAKVLPGVRGLR